MRDAMADGTETDDRPDRRRAARMAAAQAGDRAAYDALLRECVPLVRATARRQGVAPESLDDVVQDVLLTVHRARHTYDPARPFDAWLNGIARHRAIDALRRGGRHQARELHAPEAYEGYADPAEGAPAVTERRDLAKRVWDAVAALPARQREAVEAMMRADAPGRSSGAVRVSLHRAIKSLRDTLAGKN